MNADKLTSAICVYKDLHWAFYHLWFQNTFELYRSLENTYILEVTEVISLENIHD